MASEIAVTLSLAVNKSGVTEAPEGMSFSGLTFTMTGSALIKHTQLIGTSAEALDLGEVTAPHWAVFKNLDSTNFVRIRNGSGGADLLKLLAGEVACCPLYDSAVPYAIADTAAVRLRYLIVQL